jgi:argininosuccinate lyase
MKGLPLAYNKDMQEDKEVSFDAMDTVNSCLELFTGMLSTTKFNKKKMEESAVKGFTNATDAADYLVKKGMPFRDAHSVIGRLVLYCIDQGISIDEVDIGKLKEFSELFDEDVYEAISLKTCVERRLTVGAPGIEAMKSVLVEYKKYLEEQNSEV